ECIAIGHRYVSDEDITFATTDPVPHGGDIAGRTHLVASAGQGLIEHHADGGVVIGKQDNMTHWIEPSSASACNWKAPLTTGSRMRNLVRPGRLSQSMTPP